jgi:hypothetical protein
MLLKKYAVEYMLINIRRKSFSVLRQQMNSINVLVENKIHYCVFNNYYLNKFLQLSELKDDKYFLLNYRKVLKNNNFPTHEYVKAYFNKTLKIVINE